MTKVVYNACFGGFGLSEDACKRYLELKGSPYWIEHDNKYPSLSIFNVWLVPPEERLKEKEGEAWYSMTRDERIQYNQMHSEQTWNYRDIPRHDPILVQVVEELGEKANGSHANLCIAEVDGPYRIDEYDGNESVETPSSYDWIVP